jgi:hypothetical protein
MQPFGVYCIVESSPMKTRYRRQRDQTALPPDLAGVVSWTVPEPKVIAPPPRDAVRQPRCRSVRKSGSPSPSNGNRWQTQKRQRLPVSRPERRGFFQVRSRAQQAGRRRSRNCRLKVITRSSLRPVGQTDHTPPGFTTIHLIGFPEAASTPRFASFVNAALTRHRSVAVMFSACFGNDPDPSPSRAPRKHHRRGRQAFASARIAWERRRGPPIG